MLNPQTFILIIYDKSGPDRVTTQSTVPALYLGGLLLQPVDKFPGRVNDTPLPCEAGQGPQTFATPDKPDTRSGGSLIYLRRYFQKFVKLKGILGKIDNIF